jgi:hypothetical protein
VFDLSESSIIFVEKPEAHVLSGASLLGQLVPYLQMLEKAEIAYREQAF